ncbi:FCGR3 protein, partial [Nicator chloris]|nr:FCGR3 protein [Nicator chloris]
GPPCPSERLVLQVPAGPLLEGDTVTLRCRRWRNRSVTSVTFYRGDERVKRSLSPLQLTHSGRYRCEGLDGTDPLESAPVTVTVHGEHPTAAT